MGAATARAAMKASSSPTIFMMIADNGRLRQWCGDSLKAETNLFEGRLIWKRKTCRDRFDC